MYIAYMSVSKLTPWAVAGPYWQLVSNLFPPFLLCIFFRPASDARYANQNAVFPLPVNM